MKADTVKNIAHSVNTRLKNIANQEKITFEYILLRYALERFLFRLGLSSHAERFVLKGASLFSVWLGPMYRVTRDVDLHSSGESSPVFLAKCFHEICNVSAPAQDGVVFDASSIKTSEIKKDQQYQGTRITLFAYIDQARVLLQFDIGFGDTIFPDPDFREYPVLLNAEPPKIKMYPCYTVISEKFEAMVSLGIKNSRLKDFYDIWLLTEQFNFEYDILNTAIIKTFGQRKTAIPSERPFALTAEFTTDSMKLAQWNAFLRKTNPKRRPADFNVVVSRITEFLMPLIEKKLSIEAKWKAATGWESSC
jgi:hypothetical protein